MPDYDAIVIGSGVGGGSAATALSDAGLDVLVVERGHALENPDDYQDEQRMIVERIASDDRDIEISGVPARPLVGGLPGGGSTLFGGALVRPSREDFVPGRHYGDRIPRAIWEWPVDFDDLIDYYDRAEDLFGVSGNASLAPPHLESRSRPYPRAMPPLDGFNAALAESLRSQGAHPFELPLAIDFDTCRRCARCPGFVCPTGARTSTDRTLLAPRTRLGRLDYRHGTEAVSIECRGTRFSRLRLLDRATGRVLEVSADHVLLGAGAIGTPLLLEASGLGGESDELGRNHMCHLGALAVSVFPRSIGADRLFLKRLGLSDFYLGTPDMPTKMGSAQAVPVPGVESIVEQLGVRLPGELARAIHRRTILFSGFVEDLPRRANRVRFGKGGAIRIDRAFGAFDVGRARSLSRALSRLMRRAGAALVIPWVAKNDRDHLAHQVGTCRAGWDPRTSVVDGLGRLHGHQGIWVVDGSVFPTSLGVGPALTIAAHALRVADQIIGTRKT